MAPVSWLLASDAKEGREKLDFSTWNRYNPEKQAQLIAEAMNEIHEGGMPPWFYILKHPGAKISPDKIKILEVWAAQNQKARHAQEN